MAKESDVNKIIGENLYKFRLQRGIPRESLANAMEVLAAQLQKHEHGNIRFSAFRLWQFSSVLEVPVGQFYDGLKQTGQTEMPEFSSEQLALMETYNTLTDGQKRSLKDFMRLLQPRVRTMPPERPAIRR